jgi:hypothetical protein
MNFERRNAMKPSYLSALIAPLAVALTITTAQAHDRGGPCRQDLQALCPSVTPGPGSFRSCLATLCPDIAPGKGAFASCLEQHADQLSAACQEHLSQQQAHLAAWQQACGADVQTFCGDVSGRHAVGKCLHEHHDALSQSCQDLLAQHHHCHHHHQRGASPTPAS